MSSKDVVEMSVSIVNAHLSMNRMPSHDVPEFIREVHRTLQSLISASHYADQRQFLDNKPSVPIIQEKSKSSESPAAEEIQTSSFNNKVAQVRQQDISDPVFAGLDPWLAQRISPNTARKLDPSNPVHPTVFDEHLICLEDGATIKLLRPYIRNRYDLSIAEYLDKWNLPDDYPTAPPAYVERKRSQAKRSGLGTVTRARKEKKGARLQNATGKKGAASTAAKTPRKT